MIKQNMLRYTIPFCISAQSLKKKDVFSILRAAKWKEEQIVQGENDLYDYITDLVNDSVVNDVASSWKLEKEMYTQERYVTKIDEKDFFWNIAEVDLCQYIGHKKLNFFMQPE